MAGDTTNLGKAVITVEVDSSKVASGMQQAQQQAQGAVGGISGPGAFADYGGSISGLNYGGSTGMTIGPNIAPVAGPTVFTQAKKDAESAVPSMTDFMDSAKGAKREIMAFAGVAGLVATVGSSFFKLGEIIKENVVEALKTGKERAKEFADSLELTKPIELAAQLEDKLKKVNKELAAAKAYSKDEQTAETKKLEDERDELLRKLRVESEAARNGTEKKAAEDDAKRAALEKAAYQRRREEVEQEMAEKKALQLDAAEQQRELDEKEAERKQYLDDETAAKKREAAEEQYERDLKLAERMADAVEKAFTRAIQSTRDRSAGLFNVGEITNSIELLGQKLDAISRNTRSRL